MNSKKTALLVLSCDRYSELWIPFFKTFEGNWPDCPYDKYFITNKQKFEAKSFVNINTITDKSWSDNLLLVIDQYMTKYEYLLLLLDDFFIVEKVNTDKLLDCVKIFQEQNGNYLTLINEPQPNKNYNANFGIITSSGPYRTTATFALWSKKMLRELLRPGENAWQFEIYGSRRSKVHNGFYAVNNDYFIWVNAIIKGYWIPSVLKKLKKHGFNITPNKFPVMKYSTWFAYNTYEWIRKIIYIILPERSIHWLQNKRFGNR